MEHTTSVSPTPLADSPATTRRGMFITSTGQNVLVTFLLLISLFALWGFCNGLIDVMDKHFQEELHLRLEQSAWVQTAYYLGYLLMAFPAGWLATKLGYRGGIFGLGEQAKEASSFIVMAIFGGAVLPKVMGKVADSYDLSRGFIVPILCFAVVAAYGYLWPRLSGHEEMVGVNTSKGH